MNPEILRRAALVARSRGTAPEVLGADFNDPVHIAVADWLDDSARFLEDYPLYRHDGEDHALAVARAYLGGAS